jgi:hypothetical protein
MGSAPKFTLEITYYLPANGRDNTNNGHHHPHDGGNQHYQETADTDGVIGLEDPNIDDGSEESDGEEQ